MARFLRDTHFKIDIADDYKCLCEVVVQEILGLSNKIIAKQKKFTIVLAGGSTPQGIYQWMISPSYRNKFQWNKMHFFWSDERWSFPEDQNRNYRMVFDALLSKVEIPLENIHPIPTENVDLEGSACLYERTIIDFFKLKKDEFPVFDLILLGVGRDGHTSSLFPGNPALLAKDRLVVATSQIGIPEPRITLTLPVINNAEMIFFSVSGFEKADIVHEVLEDGNNLNLPANAVRPSRNKLCWYLDKDAASKLVLKPDTRHYSEN